MISVEINILPFGNVERQRQVALLAIWNDCTGDHEHGNYGWAISHQYGTRPDIDYTPWAEKAAAETGLDRPTPHTLVENGPWVWKHGELKGFRRSRGVVKLLAAVLKAARL